MRKRPTLKSLRAGQTIYSVIHVLIQETGVFLPKVIPVRLDNETIAKYRRDGRDFEKTFYSKALAISECKYEKRRDECRRSKAEHRYYKRMSDSIKKHIDENWERIKKDLEEINPDKKYSSDEDTFDKPNMQYTKNVLVQPNECRIWDVEFTVTREEENVTE